MGCRACISFRYWEGDMLSQFCLIKLAYNIVRLEFLSTKLKAVCIWSDARAKSYQESEMMYSIVIGLVLENTYAVG